MILGIGTDIVEIDRIEKAVKRWGQDFLNHVFNSEEIDYSMKFKMPYQHLAGRFAAKEAVYKAVGKKIKLGWKDITILNAADGSPYCCIKDGLVEEKIFISISHSNNYAVASAIVTQ